MQVWSLLSDYVHLDSKIKAIYIYMWVYFLKDARKFWKWSSYQIFRASLIVGNTHIYIYICTFQQCMFADLNAMELDFVLSF